MKKMTSKETHQVGAGANIATDGVNNIIKYDNGWLSGKINVPAKNEWQLMQISIHILDDTLLHKLNPFA
jgi:hypothetical protein